MRACGRARGTALATVRTRRPTRTSTGPAGTQLRHERIRPGQKRSPAGRGVVRLLPPRRTTPRPDIPSKITLHVHTRGKGRGWGGAGRERNGRLPASGAGENSWGPMWLPPPLLLLRISYEMHRDLRSELTMTDAAPTISRRLTHRHRRRPRAMGVSIRPLPNNLRSSTQGGTGDCPPPGRREVLPQSAIGLTSKPGARRRNRIRSSPLLYS